MCNFIEKIPKEVLGADYIGQLMTSISALTDNQYPYAMKVICAIAEKSPEIFTKECCPNIILSLIKVLKLELYTRIRGQTIECLTRIGKAIGKDNFSVHLNEIVEEMIAIQRKQHDVTLRISLISAWQRICSLLKEDFVKHSEFLVPAILEFVQNIPELTNLIMGKNKTIEDIEEECKDEAFNLICLLIEKLGNNSDKFLESFNPFLKGILKIKDQEILKRPASYSVKILVQAVKMGKNVKYDPTIILKTVKEYIWELVTAAEDDTFPENIIAELSIAKEILESSKENCFISTEVMEILMKLIKIMKASNARSKINNELRDQQHLDEQDAKLLLESNEIQEKIQILIAHLIGLIIETHPREVNGFFNNLYKDLLQKMLTQDTPNTQKIFALIIIQSAIEQMKLLEISQELLTEISGCIFNLIQLGEQIKGQDPRIRKLLLEVISSILIVAEGCSQEFSEAYYHKLYESICCPMPEQVSRNAWRTAQEGIVTSLSKIIWHQANKTPEATMKLITLWLKIFLSKLI